MASGEWRGARGEGQGARVAWRNDRDEVAREARRSTPFQTYQDEGTQGMKQEETAVVEAAQERAIGFDQARRRGANVVVVHVAADERKVIVCNLGHEHFALG